jgi:hypothetical protein
MLFSSLCVTLALPAFTIRHALRYVQLLDGTGPQLVDIEPFPIPREPLSDRELDAFFATSQANLERIFVARAQRDVEEIAQQGARIALGHAVRLGDMAQFAAFFRAELERVPFDRGFVDDLVRQARAHIAQGRDPLDLGPMILR